MREQRERERELRELDRDIRTVFAFNLPLKADERNLFEFFSKAGQVEDVRIIKDRNTNKSKGFAYIEYTNRVRFLGRVSRKHVLRLPPFRCLAGGGGCLVRSLSSKVEALVRQACLMHTLQDVMQDQHQYVHGVALINGHGMPVGGHRQRNGSDWADRDGSGNHGEEL